MTTPEHRKTLSRMLLVGQLEAVARITPGVSAELQTLDHVGRRTYQLTQRRPSYRQRHLCVEIAWRISSESRICRETHTSHNQGIQIADVQELLDHGSKVVVLSRGMAECFHVPRETLDFLKERQIPVHVLPTQHAVALYNKLAENEPVGGLFHTTC